MDQLSERVQSLEDRADRADINRQEIETRLLDKLTAIERVGQAQVDAIEALTEELKSQATKNELQDADIERVKQQVHELVTGFLRDNAQKAGVGIASITTVIWTVLQFAIEHWSAAS